MPQKKSSRLCEKPRILLTNDDGAHSEGIRILKRRFSPFADTFIAAPQAEQSGAGHSLTLFTPLRAKKLMENNEHIGYAVDGRPADCVKLALGALIKRKPQLVVSGINPGGNMATNVFYSGTVSAAMEAYMVGIPSMAVSINSIHAPDFTFAADFAVKMVKRLIKAGLPYCFLNVNIPDLPAHKIKGVKVTSQGCSRFVDCYVSRRDPYGRQYFWLGGEMQDFDKIPGSDYAAVKAGYVSVTPLHMNITSRDDFYIAEEAAKDIL